MELQIHYIVFSCLPFLLLVQCIGLLVCVSLFDTYGSVSECVSECESECDGSVSVMKLYIGQVFDSFILSCPMVT